MIGRLARFALVAGLALSMSPSAAQHGAGATLRVIPTADLTIIDPHFGPYITRNYGYMVYDTLLAMDGNSARSRRWLKGGRSVPIS
jgi:peptide/nickel transport system substrate-binding protein